MKNIITSDFTIAVSSLVGEQQKKVNQGLIIRFLIKVLAHANAK